MKLRNRWSALVLALALMLSLTLPAWAAEPAPAADPVETALTAAATYGGAVSISRGSSSSPRRAVPGSVSFVPGAAGLVLAGAVIRDLAGL